jgi:hypothetical protein
MPTVLCMKWGRRYGPDYVNTLRSMVQRHLTVPHRFICVTDDTRGLCAGIECRPLPPLRLAPAWERSLWRELSCFAPELEDLEDPVLFLDLDVVIIANIDCFFRYAGEFCVIENWTQPGRGIGNSSVYRYRPRAHRDILERFRAGAAEIVRRYENEQIYLSRSIGQLSFWPDEWCRSFKHHCLPGRVWRRLKPATLPADARIIVFHGQPKPPDAARGVGPARFRSLRPATWIGEHWR